MVAAMTTVPAPVHALLLSQGGLARRRDLLAAGLTRRSLERHVRSGALRRIRADLFSATSDQPPDLLLRAAVVALDAAASGTSAAKVWGIELVHAPTRQCVTVPRDRSRSAWPATTVHRSDLAEDITVRDGIRVTTVVRTVLDLCRWLPLAEAVAAADSALRSRRLSLGQLVGGCCDLPAGRGRDRVAQVVRMVDPACGSVLESLCRVLFLLAELPSFCSQLVIRHEHAVIGRVDFAWPEQRVVVEVDGYTFHAGRDSYRADRRRTNALVLAGWRVLRFSWEDITERPDVVVAQVRAALAL